MPAVDGPPGPLLVPPDELPLGGEWRQGRGAESRPSDPATGRVLATIRGASVEDVDLAVWRGAAAAADPSWRDLLAHHRARYLNRIGELIERDVERLAALQTANTGKTLTQTRTLSRSAVGTDPAGGPGRRGRDRPGEHLQDVQRLHAVLRHTKQSGIGQEKGRHGIRFYTRQMSTYLGMNAEPLPRADV